MRALRLIRTLLYIALSLPWLAQGLVLKPVRMAGDRAGICSQSRRFSSFGASKGVATGSRGGLSGKR
eukprot:scaffold259_cov252-Pinguiococcus_pyrenoidosus.AAC.1